LSSHSEYIPRGAYTPRSCCRASVCRRKTIFAVHERTFTRAAGVSPPCVLGKRTCRNASAKSRETAGGVLANAGAGPVANPRGAYAPRSYVAVRTLPAKNDFCDARTHIHKSGGRQPAVGVSNAIAIADAFVQRPASAHCWSETTVATATRWISAFRVRIPSTSHGGLTPPALGSRCPVGEQMGIFAMNERTFTRAAGVSPPWV
jgi:hypothetical protein